MEDFLWGLWNGITAWPLLVLHLFDIWHRHPVYNVERDGGWYQFGFLIGAGSTVPGHARWPPHLARPRLAGPLRLRATLTL